VSDASPGSAGEVLSQVHAQAQLEALRLFGDGPATPWQPDVPVPALLLRGLLVIAAGTAIAATAWAFAASDPDAGDAPTASVAEPARIDTAAQDEDIVDAEPSPMPGTPLPPTPARQDVQPAALVIERAGTGWRIDASHAPRLDAARRLARLSGSPLLGATELIAGTQPLDLRWQGRDLADAWQAVLGPDLNYALQCRRDRCQAWIVAAAEPGAKLPLPSSPPDAMAQGIDAAPRPDAGDQPDRLHHD
jgi:hypothetical protein